MSRVLLRSDGAEILVDEEDYELLRQYHWRRCGTKGQYAATTINDHTVYMHRLLTQEVDGFEVDHVDGNKLNNQRANLRLVTGSQNMQNRHGESKSTTGYWGVYVKKGHDKKRFYARIMVNYQHFHLGYFETAEEAAVAASDGRAQYMTHAERRGFGRSRNESQP